MAPKDVHILEHDEYVTLHGTRDCVDVIKLRILRWRLYSGLSGSSVVTKVLVRGRQESQSLKRSCEDRNKSWSDVIWRWRKGLQAKESRWPLEAGKGKDICSLLQPPEGMKACFEFWILGFLNCEIKNLSSATKFVSICFGHNKKLIHLLWLVRSCVLLEGGLTYWQIKYCSIWTAIQFPWLHSFVWVNLWYQLFTYFSVC